jgi:hypothetical protein
MTNAQIIKRVENIERQLDQIKSQLRGDKEENEWRAIAGSFANDPLFEKAMRYGAEYRRSLRPKAAKCRMKTR